MKIFFVIAAFVAVGYSAPNDTPSSLAPTTGEFPEILNLGSIPEGYHNSTHEVQTINGSRIEVNQTVTKDSEGHSIYAQIQVMVTSEISDNSTDAGDHDVLAAYKTNETNLDHQGPLTWLQIFFDHLNGNNLETKTEFPTTKEDSSLETETIDNSKPDTLPVPRPAFESNDITLIGDTDVNYIGVQPRDNPDAEIIDIDLVRADADRFFERRAQPMMSQPIRSQPLRSQPIRSQAMMSQPIRAQPMRSQPIRSQPMRSQPIRSQPMRSQPIRSQQMRSQPIRSQPMRSQPIRSQPMRSQPLRSQPIRSQSMRYEARPQSIRSQPIRSQSIRSRPMRYQVIRTQEPVRI